MPDDRPILVLGIGNILWADEGFGVRAVEELHRRYVLPDHVRIMDGGTQGLYLVQHVCEAGRLIVFDAVDFGLEAGELTLARDDEVPRFTKAKKMSLHQTGFQDVLSAAELLGGCPAEMVLIGVQAGDLETWCGPLTAAVRGQIEPALAIALDQLARWGAPARLRERPLDPAEGLLAAGIAGAIFETAAVGVSG